MFEVNKLFIIWLFALLSVRGHYGKTMPYNKLIRAHAHVISATRTSHIITFITVKQCLIRIHAVSERLAEFLSWSFEKYRLV